MLIIALITVLAAVVAVAVAITLNRASRAAFHGQFNPSLYGRVERLLAPHEGRQLSPESLEDLRRQVESVVRDTLVDLHFNDEVRVVLKNDDVLGPVCLLRTADAQELSLAEFEARLLK